ncbi:MAG: hypothetical protein JWM12_1569 [Ilumatobacteraceae bacterium]|nr:hypothetical protein [Ilumatobacteraceae bacterium]
MTISLLAGRPRRLSTEHRVAPFLQRWAGLLVAAAMCAAYLVVQPASVDYASGDFRSRLFRGGSHVWNNLWFGGHPLPGFGLIPPMLGAWIGVVPVGIASVLVGTWCLTLVVEHCRIVRPDLGDPTIASVLFALGCALNLWSGRLTFGPSVALGAGCVLAMQRRRWVIAVLCAFGCGLSSPVGAVSLAIVVAGCWFVGAFPRKLLLVVAAAAVLPIAVLGVIFPEGGWYPFTGRSMIALTIALAVVGWVGRRERVIVAVVVAYALVAAVAFVVRSPLGGNIVRLGWLAAGPVAALALHRHRRVLLSIVAVLSLIWGWSYAKMAFLPKDVVGTERFYDALATYVHTLPGGVQRVEVVPTETYRQADELALEINLARGWETQLDRKYNPELYDKVLSPDTFHRWLLDNSVSLVALPVGRLQQAAHNEIDLIRSHPGYLQLAWASQDWQVFRVVDATALATNGAAVTTVRPESLTIAAARPGTSTIRFRYTKLYRVTTGNACVSEAPGGWIDLHVATPGTVRLEVSLSPATLLGAGQQCA